MFQTQVSVSWQLCCAEFQEQAARQESRTKQLDLVQERYKQSIQGTVLYLWRRVMVVLHYQATVQKIIVSPECLNLYVVPICELSRPNASVTLKGHMLYRMQSLMTQASYPHFCMQTTRLPGLPSRTCKPLLGPVIGLYCSSQNRQGLVVCSRIPVINLACSSQTKGKLGAAWSVHENLSLIICDACLCLVQS